MRTKENSSCIKTFCENLNLLIKERGVMQKDVCRATGITPTTLTCYTKGIRNPSLDTVYKLAKYFNVSIDDLVGINAEKSDFNYEHIQKDLRFARKVKKLLKEIENDEC